MSAAQPLAVDQLLGQMPFLRAVIENHRDESPLQGCSMLLIQHQMQDAIAQVYAFLKLGLEPKDLYWIDIPYTSHAAVRMAVEQLGVPHENLWSHSLPALGVYELAPHHYQLARVATWIDCLWPTLRHRRLIVLDDGAYFARALAGKTVLGSLAIVEQTQRGLDRLRADENAVRLLEQIPVVNVAESVPKKRIEPEIIAEAVLEGLQQDLNEIKWESSSRPWLLLGFGSIGSAVSRHLSRAFHREPASVSVYDVNPHKQAQAEAAGHSTWNRARHREPFELVIGCTGSPSLSLEDINVLADGAVLASGSSSSIEMSRDQALSLVHRGSNAVRLLNCESAIDLHEHLHFQWADGRRFWILNGGFPVNFDRDCFDRIEPVKIQVTAGLMTSAAIQAAGSRARGLVDLDLGTFESDTLNLARLLGQQ